MVWALFVCAKCGGRKPISGRTKYKKTGEMKERMAKCHSR